MTNLEWALYYVRLGLAVFPIKPRDKTPLTEHGFLDASKEQAQIEHWWTTWPVANIGIATGAVSGGLVVVDLDVDDNTGIDGRETLREWEKEHAKLPDKTWISITGRGGYHYFYRDPSTVRNRTGIYEGIDIRGDGGYVVAPPSIHPNGNAYEWEQDPMLYSLADADGVVFDFLLGAAPKGWNKKPFELPEQIPDGQRTNAMVKLVCSQQSKGLSDEAIRAAVRAENEAKCVPPLTDQELEKQVFPALSRYQKGTAPYIAAYNVQTGSYQVKTKKDIGYTGADMLMAADLPPIVHIVKGMLTKGLGGISAKSKLGKSWMALQLSVDVACGDSFLGFTTMKCGVLYIDLENTPSLTQDRLRMILDGREPPKNLYFAHDFNLMGEGFEEDLSNFLSGHPDVKLVIIDVFQKVKRGKQPSQTDYEADYEILTKLKQIADKFGVCIMPVYHDRKFVDPTDPFSNLLGSTAIIGVSDFIWVLFKEKREDKEATLAVTGRTLIESSYKLKRNGVKWENLGNAAAVEETRKRLEYDRDPVVNTIRKLVSQGGGKWKGRVKEIIESSQYFKGCRIYGSSQKVGNQIKTRIEDLEKYDEIHHSTIDNGTAASIHVFEAENPFLRDWS